MINGYTKLNQEEKAKRVAAAVVKCEDAAGRALDLYRVLKVNEQLLAGFEMEVSLWLQFCQHQLSVGYRWLREYSMKEDEVAF